MSQTLVGPYGRQFLYPDRIKYWFFIDRCGDGDTRYELLVEPNSMKARHRPLEGPANHQFSTFPKFLPPTDRWRYPELLLPDGRNMQQLVITGAAALFSDDDAVMVLKLYRFGVHVTPEQCPNIYPNSPVTPLLEIPYVDSR